MTHPLLLLLMMRIKALLRRLVRPGSVKRFVVGVVGIVLVAVWVMPALVAMALFRNRMDDPTPLHTFGPVVLLLMTLGSMLAARRGGIVFSPPEIDLLFPAPFSRRALLLYKLAATLPGAVLMGLFFSLWLHTYSRFWVIAFLAVVLTSLFMQLVVVGVALLVLRLRESSPRWTTTGLIAAAAVVAVLLAAQTAPVVDPADPVATLWSVVQAPVLRVLASPFRLFTEAFAAEDFVYGVQMLLVGAALNVLLLAGIIRLDADYLEASIAASQRMQQRLERARRGGGWAGGAAKSAKGQVPDLPFLTGAGPMLWVQLVRLRRQPMVMLLPLVLGIVIPAFLFWQAGRAGHPEAARAMLIMLVPLTLFLTAAMRFDFRADVDHMDRLKSLPVGAVALTMGQLTAPVLMVTLILLGMLGTAAAFGAAPASMLLTGAAFAPLAAGLLLGVDNLVFLLAPTRVPAVGIDIHAIGRQALLALVRAMVLAVAALPAVVVSGAVFLVTDSLPAATAGAWVCLFAAVLALVWAVAEAFRRLDVAMDVPA